MVLVMAHQTFPLFAVSPLLLVFGGCDPRPKAERAAPNPSMSVPTKPAAGASSNRTASPVVSAPPSAPVPVLADYPTVEKSLVGACDDPRAVLAIRKEYDRSGRIWVQQALLAHSEFKLVEHRASSPGEVDVYETIYGIKNFSRSFPGQPRFSEAVIARCADVTTCNRVAAMFHAVSPRDATEVVCGAPPSTTGGFSRVSELRRERMVLPDTKASKTAICARVHACGARVRSPRAQALDCEKVPAQGLAACAAHPSCEEVAGCVSALSH